MRGTFICKTEKKLVFFTDVLLRNRLYLMAYMTSLEGQVTLNLTVFATSAFSAHSLIATVLVVQAVVLCMSISHCHDDTRH